LERTETISTKRVRLYTDTLCPICEVVERFLSERGVEYTKINADEELEAKEALVKQGYESPSPRHRRNNDLRVQSRSHRKRPQTERDTSEID
jgi:glutaredoxin